MLPTDKFYLTRFPIANGLLRRYSRAWMGTAAGRDLTPWCGAASRFLEQCGFSID
jgi:hypothetical protein